MRLRCAVLDDFQQVATELADWSPVADRVETVSFREHFATEAELADALAAFDIVVTLRERVTFPASLLARLPRLKLLVASGMRNSVIDYAAAEAHGVTVCGTASTSTPPVELTWALLLGLARGIVEEAGSLRSGGPWQQTVGADLHGRRLDLLVRGAPKVEGYHHGGHHSHSDADCSRSADLIGLCFSLRHDFLPRFLPRMPREIDLATSTRQTPRVLGRRFRIEWTFLMIPPHGD